MNGSGMAAQLFAVGAHGPVTKRNAPNEGHIVVLAVSTDTTSGKTTSNWLVLPAAHARHEGG